MTVVTPSSERELIEGLRAGSRRALEALLAAFWNPLCQYAGGILNGAADPQDVVQEAFIKLWDQRDRWRVDGSLKALLYTVTRNAALDELRRAGRMERGRAQIDIATPEPTPSEHAVAGELERAAARAVSALPPKRQEVFRLAREEGLTYAEIAEVLGRSPQTVANQMSLAMADLRAALAPYLSDKPPP
jgi:RNA polymerase sigma-70 factor (ECF subfamily)